MEDSATYLNAPYKNFGCRQTTPQSLVSSLVSSGRPDPGENPTTQWAFGSDFLPRREPLHNCSWAIRNQSCASPSCKQVFLCRSYFNCFTIKLRKGLLIDTRMPRATVVIYLMPDTIRLQEVDCGLSKAG